MGDDTSRHKKLWPIKKTERPCLAFGALIVANLGGRDGLPLLEKHLNVRQKGKTSSDSEEVGLASVDVAGPIFYHRPENSQTSSESEEV